LKISRTFGLAFKNILSIFYIINAGYNVFFLRGGQEPAQIFIEMQDIMLLLLTSISLHRAFGWYIFCKSENALMISIIGSGD
jgi:hypothetical protein